MSKIGELLRTDPEKTEKGDRGVPIFYDIISTTDGRIIACGQDGNDILSGGKYRTGWIVCIDSSGNNLWERRYVLEETREAGNNFYFEIESEDGGLILFGILYNKNGGSDAYVLRTDYFGCLNEECDLYNFISFSTSTKDLEEAKNLYFLYFDNTILNIVSKELVSIENLSYEMINLNGSVVTAGKLNGVNTQINISGLVPGLYFIRIYDNLGKTASILKFYL